MRFTNINNETEENLRLALLSLWAPGSHPMRKPIEQLFKEEPLLAEPVFQSTFGWEQAISDSWKESLNNQVINKLKIGVKYPPYKHQAESWKQLKEGKSIVVTSGTGSGKTECFMYPVLNDLYEQGNTNAVQALFLYPLNALMEDQKDRLSDYCQAVGLKYAVYNGDTPEYRVSGELLPNEVGTRDEIRDPNENGTRPQILLTNPSMLEYILVRQRDQVMLQKSAGKLRWIVIDEAHSYSGSSAVELANQIKRILEAFEVRPEQVRFACTSATIGGSEGAQSLIKFISGIIGQPEQQIKEIGGNRLVPPISTAELDSVLKPNDITIKAKYILSLRKKINEVAGMSLRQLWEWLCPTKIYDMQEALELIDKLCDLRVNDEVVMSLRAHFFMRAISGLYACANDKCPGTSQTPYGNLTTYKAAVCEKCGKPLLELVQCKRCGSFILMGTSNPQSHIINPCEDGLDHDDYFAIDEESEQEDLDEETTNVSSDRFYLLPYNKETYFNPLSSAHTSILEMVHKPNQSLLESNPGNSGQWVELRKDLQRSYCPSCGRLAHGKRLNFKYFRIPINFINQTISPVFLKECASEGQPWGKYIAFTDSRQGTAISAKTFNIDVERRICRERVVEDLAKRSSKNNSTLNLDKAIFDILSEKQKSSIINLINNSSNLNSVDLAKLIYTSPIFSNIDLSLKPNIHYDIQTQLNIIPNIPESILLCELTNLIFNDVLFNHIVGGDKEHDAHAYKAALIRHFIGTRSLYEMNAENMGLITLEYTDLKDVRLPEVLADFADKEHITITDQDWKDFLKICLDYYLRQANHIQPLIPGERKYVRNSSKSSPISASDDRRSGISSWVSVKVSKDGKVLTKQSRLVVLLCAALGIDSAEKLEKNVRNINSILSEAWKIFVDKKILTKVEATDDTGYNHPKYYPNSQYIGCYYLDLSGTETNTVCRIKRAEKVWECPVSKRLVDTTFCGYSPMINGEISPKLFRRCRCSDNAILMPKRPLSKEELTTWLSEDTDLATFKAKGFWTDRHKDAYNSSKAYLAAEHSAQQSKDLLREYTKKFSAKNPSINVLHCSTTMEMGVDIGDIDIVVMDTIPPTAANYMQRVGRAGRMGQTKAIAFSLCSNTPVGQNAFANPMWALQTTNHMIPVRTSQTIVQRHVNSFFFRQFICSQEEGMKVTGSVGEFMDGDNNKCDAFINFLDEMSTNKAAKQKFHEIFGSEPFTINISRDSIAHIQKEFDSVVKELEEALKTFKDDSRRKIAISNQIKKYKQENLLNYLSEHQFIPNASMPTGVVTFDFTDKEQAQQLFELYRKAERKKNELELASSDADKTIKRQNLNDINRRIQKLRRETQASRDIHTALNEYAPEQTVVVNERNYVSAGVSLFGAYNEETQTRAIYHCKHCGKIEYLPKLDENKRCPNCDNPYRSIIGDKNNSSYTLAYEPIGFRTDQKVDSSREEKTEKRYYEILPVLLKSDWTHSVNVNMCQVSTSGETGEILYYNVGNRHGFAFCKRCGRAVVELSDFDKNPPISIRPGHNRLWGDVCDANIKDIARHVVFTGRHQTNYSVLRFKKDNDCEAFEKDDDLAYSLGVILKRALVSYLGIDEGEIDFGYKKELDNVSLFIFDTARGGCGYSLHFGNPTECEKIFDIARKMLSEYDCNCHVDGGACTKCLIDRNNYRYANHLSKGKVLDWLNKQKAKPIDIPNAVKKISPSAKVVYQSLKNIVKRSIGNSEVSSLIFCVSDEATESVINDWCSSHVEIGKLVRKGIENGKQIEIKIEYHPEYHNTNADKLPFIVVERRIPDCDVSLIKDQGHIKTALVVNYLEGGTERFFTDEETALSFSNDWGENCNHLYVDNIDTAFHEEAKPILEHSPSEIIRDGFAKPSQFEIANYFSKVIAPSVLKAKDIDSLKSILKNKHVTIFFSDMYVNSALAGLMLVSLIKEMQTLFEFTIDDVTLQLDSPKRRCVNDRFNDYTYINFNFPNKEEADNYTFQLFEEILDIEPECSMFDAEHHRFLRIENQDGDMIEIRPDHSISGGWYSKSTYMNLDRLDGSVSTFRKEDILYYVIIKKRPK